MTALVGTYSLCAAVLVAAATLLVSLAAVRFSSEGLYRTARRGIALLALLFTIASAALIVALLQSDFRLEYVEHYTERALPFGYKLAAFWAGQAGSLLLWGWILAVLSLVFVIQQRRSQSAEHGVAVATLAVVIGFFAALMLFANTDEAKANPFEQVTEVAADGHGLNPMLQDPGMIAHPPMLFIGYAGFAIPFALLLGALVTGKLDDAWTAAARPWVLVSWLFLGVGILLGAWWAYKELGWGGYWAWDPVENASLLPWLTATALLHSIIVQRQRGMLRRWTALLAALTFILCILGTYITRSGVVDSVHTFGQSLVGSFFLAFLLFVCSISGILLITRWGALRAEREAESIVSRESAVATANYVLTGMMLATAFFTFLPAITRAMTMLPTIFFKFLPAFMRPTSGQAMSGATQTPYNRIVLPLAMVLVALMAVAPLLKYGRMLTSSLSHRIGLALVATAEGIILLAVAMLTLVPLLDAICPEAGIMALVPWLHLMWPVAAAGVAIVLTGSIAADLVTQIRARQRSLGENVFLATVRLVDGNHRRYGGHIVHVGIVMIVLGVVGSSLYGTKETVELSPGQSVDVGRYHLTLNALDEYTGDNFDAMAAKVTMLDQAGERQQLQPERRQYNKAEQASSQVAIQSSWREDLYVTLAAWDPDTKFTTLEVIINPLVTWIWAGGVVLMLGGLFCLAPRLLPGAVMVQSAVPATAGKSRRRVEAVLDAAAS